MTIEFTFGDNSDKSSIFFKKKFMNLIDHDLTAHQITQTLTLSRLVAQLEQTRGIRLFTHTQQVDWKDKGNQTVSNQVSFVCCLLSNAVKSVSICGVTSWNGSMTNTAWLGSIVCAQMLQLVKFGIDWICGELEQIVNIPVTQIVEEITEVNIPVTQIVEEIADREYSSYTDCGRDHRGEHSSYSDCGRDRRS